MMLSDLNNQSLQLEYFLIADFHSEVNFMVFVMVHLQFHYQEGNKNAYILDVCFVWKKDPMQQMLLNIVLDHVI